MQRFAESPSGKKKKKKKKKKNKKKAITKCCILMRAFLSFCLISLSQTIDLDRREWIENF
jgi:hypothetical protein